MIALQARGSKFNPLPPPPKKTHGKKRKKRKAGHGGTHCNLTTGEVETGAFLRLTG